MKIQRNLNIVATIDDLKRIDEAWKAAPGYYSRSQYVRAAINEKAGGKII